MKYLRQNIQLLFAFVLMLGFFSCTDEDAVDNGKKEIREGLPTTVTLKLTSATPMVVETKTEDSNGKFGKIDNLAILVYKTDGVLDKLTYVPDIKAKEWNGTFNATTGKRRVYVLANSGLGEDGIKDAYSKEENLLNLGLIDAGTTIPVGKEQMLGFVHAENNFGNELLSTEQSETISIPESNGSTSVVSLYSRLYPPYSKITFTVKNEVKTDMSQKVQLNITNVYVRNLPTKYSLIPQNRILQTSDVNHLLEGSPLKGNDDVYTFYMYENLQGDYSDNGEDGKNPGLENQKGDIWDYKWATKTPCSYIEVEGTYAIWKSSNEFGAGKIHYRFFLGENTTTNFDIKRNTHYNIDLVFTEVAGYDEIQYEWRVKADLEHSIFVPEGELVIDGACDVKQSFYVVNNTSDGLSFSTDGYSNSDMKFSYMDKYNYPQEESVPSDFLLPSINKGTAFKVEVRPVNIGVLGSPGHCSTYTTDSYNYYSYNGDQKEVSKSYEDNYHLRNDIAKGQIFRKRKVQYTVSSEGGALIIYEYPLLYLGDSETHCKITDPEAVYAQRIDYRGGIASSQDVANAICPGTQSGSAGGTLRYTLPTSGNLLKIVEYEKKFPLREGEQYWTDKGLWSSTGVVDNSKGGYVRCVYRK